MNEQQIDTIASTGMSVAEAGTALRGSLLRLISPTRQAVKAMERLGIALDASIPRSVGPRRGARRAHRKRLKRR